MNDFSYKFKNPSLLEAAFTHGSYAHENRCTSYQRLEFVGDAVLELIIRTYLFKKHPDMDEGWMTEQKIKIVNNTNLAVYTKKLGLNHFVRLGKGAIQEDQYINKFILADVLESVIGAIYLDGGFQEAEKFVVNNICKHL